MICGRGNDDCIADGDHAADHHSGFLRFVWSVVKVRPFYLVFLLPIIGLLQSGPAMAIDGQVNVTGLSRLGLGASTFATARLSGFSGGQRRQLTGQLSKSSTISSLTRNIVARSPVGLKAGLFFVGLGYVVDWLTGAIHQKETPAQPDIADDGYCGPAELFSNDLWSKYNDGLVLVYNRSLNPDRPVEREVNYQCSTSSRSDIENKIIMAWEDSDRFSGIERVCTTPTLSGRWIVDRFEFSDGSGRIPAPKIKVLHTRSHINWTEPERVGVSCDNTTYPKHVQRRRTMDWYDWWPATVETPPGLDERGSRLTDDEILEQLPDNIAVALVKRDLQCYLSGDCPHSFPWESWLPQLIPGAVPGGDDNVTDGDATPNLDLDDLTEEEVFDLLDELPLDGAVDPFSDTGLLTPYDLGVGQRTCPVDLGKFTLKVIPGSAGTVVQLPSNVVCALGPVISAVLMAVAWIAVLRLFIVAL